MAYNSFIPRRAFGELIHCEYITANQPSTKLMTSKGNPAGSLSGRRVGDKGGAGANSFSLEGRGLGGNMIELGESAYSIPSRNEWCACGTRLSRYNRTNVCACCSTRDADRAHR